MVPDFTLTVDASMRYESVVMHRDVPTADPPDQLVGCRLPEKLDRELMYQVATAAERAICLNAPVEIRYHMKIKGRLVLSRAVISVDSAAKMLTFHIARILSVSGMVCGPALMV